MIFAIRLWIPTVPDANLRQGIFPIPVCINRNDVAGSTCTGANILPRKHTT